LPQSFHGDYALLGQITSLMFLAGMISIWFVPEKSQSQIEDEMSSPPTIKVAVVGDNETISHYVAIADRIPGIELIATVRHASLLHDHISDTDAILVREASEVIAVLAKSGKHVLLTDIPPDSAIPVIAAEVTDTAKWMIGTPLRFQSDVAAVKGSLDAGELGDPGLLRIHCWESSDQIAGTRMLADLEIAIWIFNALPNSIYAIGPSEKYQQVHFGFPNDGMALIDVNTALPQGNDYRSLSLIGSHGAAYADDHHNVQLVYRGEHPSAVKTRTEQGARLAQLREFVESIQTDRQPIANRHSYLATMKVAAAINESINSGQASRLNGDNYELI
jgi:hypothetical protein